MQGRIALVFVALLVAFPPYGRCAQYPLTVILVRDAEKAATPADDPELSDAGKIRAKTLETLLVNAGIGAIYASGAASTQFTVKPLADHLGLGIHHQFPATQPRELAQAILKGKDRVVLVAGHSNQVPAIIAALGGGPVPEIQDAWEFDNLYVVTVYAPGKASTLRLRYGEPSTPGTTTLRTGGSRIMRVHIARSGGFAAVPGLALEATLDLSRDSARVTQAGGDYARDLSAQETQDVRRMLDPVRFFQLPRELRALTESGSRSARTSVADQRQYDITVYTDDGREHSVKASEMMTDELERLAPGLGKFLNWTKLEFDGIMNHKLRQR